MKEIGKDITIITKDTCNDFVKKVDKNTQKSIFEAFEDADTVDENGNHGKDHKLTGNEIENFFTALGIELKQKFQNWYDQKTDIENIIDSTQPYNTQNNKKTVYDRDKYTAAILSINSDNIEDLFFNNNSLAMGQDILYQFLNPHFLNTENRNPRTKEEIIADCTHIRKVLSEWCKNNGIDTSELDNTEIKLYPSDKDFQDIKKPDNHAETVLFKYFNLMRNHLDAKYFQSIMERDLSDKMQAAIDKRYNDALKNNEKLTSDKEQVTSTQRYNARGIKKLDKMIEQNASDKNYQKELKEYRDYYETTLNDPGNGIIDKTATQITGACWLLSELEAFLATPKGKEFIENHKMKDNEKHIFAIHIQQAEDRNLPRPNGDGIYVLTEKEVMESQSTEDGLVAGEGDIAAYALAFERYMKDANILPPEEVNGHYINSYYMFGLFEMMTGAEIEPFDLSTCGIKYDERDPEEIENNPLDNFEDLQKLVAEQNSAIVLGFEGKHLFSVVGTEGEYLLCRESSNNKHLFEKIFKVKEGFPPTYMITKEDYQTRFNSQAGFRWK